MSAIPEDLPIDLGPEPPLPAPQRPGGLPRSARIYLILLAGATLAAAGGFYVKVPHIHYGWGTLAILAAAATIAHTFPVKSPRNSMYHTSIVFIVAAALLLPPELIVLIRSCRRSGVAQGALPVADPGL